MQFQPIASLALVGALMVGGCSVITNPARVQSSISDAGPSETGGIGVNAYLWRASLDTLDFMPLASADPWGGVINTDWYTNPEQASERFKITVYILDTRLRADGLTATVIREEKGPDGNWITAPTSQDTRIAIENAILTRARQLRLSTIEDK